MSFSVSQLRAVVLAFRMRYSLITISIFLCIVFQSTINAEELRPSFLMFSDPAFEVPTNSNVLPPKIVDFWRSALQSSNTSHRLAAANDISVAYKKGFHEVKAAIAELREMLRNESENARTVVAQILIELDAREAADDLFDYSRRSGSQFRLLVEPALAKWDYQAIRPVWRSRFKDQSVFRRELILACRGSGQVKDKQALESLIEIVHSSNRPQDIRLAAAEAAGQITGSKLEQDAQKLMDAGKSSLINRLCAVALLQRHQSKQSQKLLVKLFDDPSAPVASAAVRRLLEIDPAIVLNLSSRAWEHSDVNIRRVAAKCLTALPNADRLVILANHLHDTNPALRKYIRNSLLEHVQKPEFKTVILDSVKDVLNSDDWRGQEQACLILGQIDHEPAAKRFVQLLTSERPEVMIASAWALKKVAVKSTLPAILAQAQLQTSSPQAGDLETADRQVSHLFEAMAVMNFRQAIPLMQQYIPFQEIRLDQRLSRGAAIWALGHLLASDQDDLFAAQLMGRIKAASGIPQEIDIVVRMSTISLGRIKANSQLQELKNLAGPKINPNMQGLSMKWAIHKISGETIPLDKPLPKVARTWRIQPISTP